MTCTRFILAVALLVPVSSGIAQERTAGGALDTQMTWSGLSAQIGTVKTQIDAVNTRVDQAVVCGRKGMVYAPDTNDADSQGCVMPATASSVINQLTNLQNSVGGVQNSVNISNSCGSQGKVSNGGGCVNPASSAPSISCRVETAGATGQRSGGEMNYNGCPDGYTVVRGYNVGNHTTSCLRVVCN